jgi:uncharacterized membrane protein
MALHASRRRATVLLVLLLTSGFAVSLFAARALYTGTDQYRNMIWNLFLAWVPFVVALVVYDRHRRGGSGWALALPGLAWLLFLPNAPYLVTDFFLLRWIGGAPVWFDVVLLTAFAWNGLLLGFASLYLVHSVVRERLGRASGWLVVLVAIALSSFGIYLGRFLRWNSWDFFVQPTAILADVWSRLSDPATSVKPVAVTVLFTGFLTLAYLALYSLVDLAREDAPKRG